MYVILYEGGTDFTVALTSEHHAVVKELKYVAATGYVLTNHPM